MYNNQYKKNPKSLKVKSDQMGPDEKKAKLGDSWQNALNHFTTSQSSAVHDYVKLNVNNSLNQVDNSAFKNFQDFTKQGKYYVF